MREPRPLERKRWRQRIAAELADSTRQLGVLASAMGAFGADFDLEAFTEAYESDDVGLYERAKLVEAALTSVQGAIGRLSEDGARLAGLERRPHRRGEPRIAPSLEALAEAGAITVRASKRLIAIQGARNAIEHAYVELSAKRLHAATADLALLGPEFLDRYARWIEPYLAPEPSGR